MSTPKLVSAPPQGSGLVPSLVDRHYRDLVQGKPGEHIVAVVVLQPVGQSSRRTKDGIHTAVTYEPVRLEVVHDAHDADQATWLMTRAHDQRHSGSEQVPLPFDNPTELRESTLAAIKEWAGEEGLSDSEVNARWVDYFGGPEHASSATVDHGALVQLREFAYSVKAIADDKEADAALEKARAAAGDADDDLDVDPNAGQDPADDEGDDDEPADGAKVVPFSGGAR